MRPILSTVFRSIPYRRAASRLLTPRSEPQNETSRRSSPASPLTHCRTRQMAFHCRKITPAQPTELAVSMMEFCSIAYAATFADRVLSTLMD